MNQCYGFIQFINGFQTESSIFTRARLFRTYCRVIHFARKAHQLLLLSSAHSDAIWGASWTENDTVISISADGSIKQWSAASGKPHPTNATFPTPHTLAQVSLSVSLDGNKALYNSIEGTTSLWNLENGEVVATFKSYAAKGTDCEPCKFKPYFTRRQGFPNFRFSMVCFFESTRRNICINRYFRECFHSFRSD